MVVDVDHAAHNIGYRINFSVRRISDRQFFLRLVSQPRSTVVAPACLPIERLAGNLKDLRDGDFPGVRDLREEFVERVAQL
jgi:hypothetical protein